MKLSVSIRKVYITILCFLLPVSLVLFGVNSAVRFYLLRHMSQNVYNTVQSQHESLLASYQNVDKALLVLIADNDATLQKSTNSFLYYQSLRDIQQRLGELFTSFSEHLGFFYYDLEEDTFIKPSSVSNYESLQIKEIIRKHIQSLEIETTRVRAEPWTFHEYAPQQGFLLRLYHRGSRYIGAWVTNTQLEKKLSVNRDADNGGLLLLAQGDRLIYCPEVLSRAMDSEPETVSALGKEAFLKNRPMFTFALDQSGIQFIYATSPMENYNLLTGLMTAFLSVTIVICLLGIATLVWIRKGLMQPLTEMLHNKQLMDALSLPEENEGKLHIQELDQLNRIMIGASQSIQNLQMSVYEQELERRRAEVEMLQFQIRPHFYINCLTIIYSMSQSQKFQEIQEFSMLVAEYMRELYRTGTRLVRFKSELQRVEKYLQINSIRYQTRIDTVEDMDEAVENVFIPPLIIQTLTENCVIHSLDLSQEIVVEIKAHIRILEGQERLEILILDNGTGFSEDVLQTLNEGVLLEKDGRKVGLSNTMRRIRYYCGEQGKIEFSNREEGGAQVRMVLPVMRTDKIVWKQEEKYEHSDRG